MAAVLVRGAARVRGRFSCTDELPAATAAELDRLNLTRIVVLGEQAAVSDAVAMAAGVHGTVTRIAGADRYATAAAVSASTFPAGSPVYVATGIAFADALAAVAAAGLDRASLLLTAPTSLPVPTATELERLAPPTIVVLGGTSAIDAETEAEVSSYRAP